MSWYHNVNGAQAEQMLKAANVLPGTYLVRPSQEAHGSTIMYYALSVKESRENVCHIKIVHEDDQFQLFGRPEQFATINDLINCYVENPKMLKPKESGDLSAGFLQLTEPYATGTDDIRKEKWFHGQIDGFAAQQLLQEYGKSGSFLVRESYSTPGAFVLVVKSAEDEVRNIKINKSNNQFDIGCGDKFISVSDLVQHYLQKPIIIKPGHGDVMNHTGPVLLQHGLPSTRVHAKSFVKKFVDFSNCQEFLQIEFENLQSRKQSNRKLYLYTAATKAENRNKNRSTQIIPLDSNRVLLPDQDSDYINASHVAVELEQGFRKQYILTQTPLKDTVDDFWKMIWHCNVKVIVMLTERSSKRVMVDYWDATSNTCPFTIKVQRQSNYYHPGEVNAATQITNHQEKSAHWISTVLEITKKNAAHSETRKIHHYKFTSWDTYPPRPEIFVEFVEKIRTVNPTMNIVDSGKNKFDSFSDGASYRDKSPIVVHDLMGIGRAGVFVAVDSLVAFTQHTSMRCNIDIAKLVLDLRAQRENTVQLAGQYEFIYRCVHCHLTRLEIVLDTRNKARAKGHDYTNVGGSVSPAVSMTTVNSQLSTNLSIDPHPNHLSNMCNHHHQPTKSRSTLATH
ncbi:tyrosine-protein phosphatase non-receptor type 11-like [Convolutriloba macropyga]|uniref:tyrosine-protein phosphatase non-receptor type 11-like n=1 Tax=Convolutriloba macropyga TaxID=536237 RepID=UPI003F522AFB